MKEEENIELRSEEFQEVLGKVPSWILRWGISALAVVVMILLIGSAIIKYPDVIPAQIILTGSTPPATVVAHASGKIKRLYVSDNQIAFISYCSQIITYIHKNLFYFVRQSYYFVRKIGQDMSDFFCFHFNNFSVLWCLNGLHK